jgi:uncharacterized protein (TIGR03086 family)
MPDMVALFTKATEEFNEAVHAIKDDQWTGSTPCTEWDVRALLRHLVYEVLWMPPLLAGQTIEQVGDRFEGEILGDDPVGAWDAASAAAVESVQKPGAMEVITHLSFGDTPGEEYTTQVAFDLFIHGWDMRTAIGIDSAMDASILADIMPWAEKMMESYRAAGAVAAMPPIPDDASDQTRMLALTGRKG